MNLDEPYLTGDEETDNSEHNDTIPFLRHYDWDEFNSAKENVSLHRLVVKFKVKRKRSSFDDYLLFCNQKIQSAICNLY